MLFAVALFMAPTVCQGQPTGEPVVIGEKLTIESRVLGESRPLMIAKPSGYDDGTERYPVVYLLDGGPSNFRHTTGIVSFLDFAGGENVAGDGR